MRSIILIVALTLCLIVGMSIIESERIRNLNQIELEYQQSLIDLGINDNRDVSDGGQSSSKTIDCTISGAIKKPGTYILDEDSYLYQLIEAAGGLKSTADTEAYNEYYLLKDGDEIYISKTTQESKISINKGDLDDLDSIVGIGSTLAQRIIDYRDINGEFSKLEDLMNVQGIGETLFNKIKDSIKL